MYRSNWCGTLEAHRSISGVPLIWHNFMKIVEFSFHSLKSLVCLDSLCASKFIDLGKYLVVIVIFYFKRYCQISLLIAVNSWFLVPRPLPPFSLSMTGLSCCPCGYELIFHSFPLMWRTLQLIWLPWAPRHLCETFVPPRTMASLLSVRDNSLHSLVMMHLSLLLFVLGEKLKISCCRELNFLSTITGLCLPPPKLPLSSWKVVTN